MEDLYENPIFLPETPAPPGNQNVFRLDESVALESNPSYYATTRIDDAHPTPSCRNEFKYNYKVHSCCFSVGLILVGVVACTGLIVSVWGNLKSGEGNGVSLLDGDVSATIEFMRAEFRSVKASVQRLEAASTSFQDEMQATVQDVVRSLQALNSSIARDISSLLDAIAGLHPSFPAASCQDIVLFNPLNFPSPSGYYWVRAPNGSAVRVYCDMSRSCGSVTGGWMRVASLDFASRSSSCPAGLRERNDSDIRTCGINSTACASILFDTYGIPYTSVCGKVLAYQFGTTDAFGTYGLMQNQTITINSTYVDGVSLTHGSNPR